MANNHKVFRCGNCGKELPHTDFTLGNVTCPHCRKKNKQSGSSSGCIIAVLILSAVFVVEELVVGALGVFEEKMLPFREWVVDTFGESSALELARESDDYFLENGTLIDFSFDEITAISDQSKNINEYKIEITEKINRSQLYIVVQKITFEFQKDVIKVEVTPKRAEKAKNETHYNKLFTDLHLLPFGTYYIVTENDEKHILIDSGAGDGQENKTKTAIRATDNKALYNKLMSYGIEQIIDYKTIQKKDVSCYEFAKVREYSSPSSTLQGVSEFHLRVYDSKPGRYLMRNDNTKEKIYHEILCDFYYSGVNKKLPKRSEYNELQK